MRFRLIDTVLACDDQRAVAIKNVTSAEEYLADHFPGFPVLPGVFMIEAMAQASREVLRRRRQGRFVLGQVRALRYGSFVRPGEALRVEVTVEKEGADGSVSFRGTGSVVRLSGAAHAEGETAVAGRFIMRPVVGRPT